MFNLNDYAYFNEGEINIGISTDSADKVYSSIKNSKIKKEYIIASSPQLKIFHKEFYIKKKLTTLGEFKNFISDTSYKTEAENDGWGWIWDGKWIKKKGVSWKNPFIDDKDIYYNDRPDIFPVMQISWNDAVAYTKWFASITGKIIRLPFEYEWEIFGNFAGVRSMTGIYSAGSLAKNSGDDNFLLFLEQNILNSEFQLGFLWEWTSDWYEGYDNTIRNKDFGRIYKILRGGSILSEEIQRSKEFRFRRCPTARSPYYGFRIVIENLTGSALP